MLDDVTENSDILLAILGDPIFLPGAPPFDGLQAIAALRSAESVLGELVEFHAVAELLVEFLVNIKGAIVKPVNGSIGAENLEIEAVAVEGDDVSELLEFGDQIFHICLEPTPEAVLLVPCDGNSDTKCANVGPAALDFMGKAESFDIQINFPIE